MELFMHNPKSSNYTPKSLIDFEGCEDDRDFLQDPEKLCDVLPQPYRMVDRLIEDLYCDVWEIIKIKEESYYSDLNKVRPPRYYCSVPCDLGGRAAVCLTASVDGQYIFVSSKDALMAIHAGTQNIISCLDEQDVEITSMECALMNPSIHIIASIDDLGVAKIFAFFNERFSLLKIFSETDPTVKTITTKCVASAKADYLGLVQECTATGDCCLEIYKLPLDIWIKEFDTLASQIDKQKALLIQELIDSQSALVSTNTPVSQWTVSKDSHETVTVSPDHPTLLTIERAYKFTQPTLTLKIKPPIKLTACPSNNISAACRAIDTGDIIGQGTSHLFTQQYIDQRENVFNYLQRDLLEYLPTEEEEVVCQPTFHFLNQGRMTVSVDPLIPPDYSSSVAVWWMQSRFVYHYSLVKFPLKDLEQKADLVIPLSHRITCSAVSPCTSLLALGLHNGTVILWDRYIGIEKGVIDLGDSHTIDSIQFMNPAAYHTTSTDSSQSECVILLVLSNKAHLHLVTFGPGWGVTGVVDLCDSLLDDNSQRITYLQPLEHLPNVIVRVGRNGVMYIHDVIGRSVLCEIVLPQTHEPSSPWQPLVVLGDGGQMLFVNGTCVVNRDNDTLTSTDNVSHNPSASITLPVSLSADDNTDRSQLKTHTSSQHLVGSDVPAGLDEAMMTNRLFTFQLRSFPCFDDLWVEAAALRPFVTHCAARQRVDLYMKQRHIEQGERKTRMQLRWGQLKQELMARELTADTCKQGTITSALPQKTESHMRK